MPDYPFGQLGGVLSKPPYRMQPGLGRLDLAYWLVRDDKFEEELAQKRLLLKEHRRQVVQVKRGSEDAQAELRQLVEDQLSLEAPAAEHEIERAGLLTQEDFCILEKSQSGDYVLTAGCVCFPSRWDLPAKMGKNLSAIHKPVPLFEDTLSRVLKRLFEGLQVDRPVWRQNWALDTTPVLFQPTGHGEATRGYGFGPDDIATKLWLRSEYQTLRRMPKTQAIIFGIRNFVWPLSDLTDPSEKSKLAALLDTMPLELQNYKSVTAYKQATIAYLTAT